MHRRFVLTPNRRLLVKTLAASACVVGFDAMASTWITAEQAGATDAFHGLPRLDGALHIDEPTRTAYAQDFGQIVYQQPLAVLKPGSVEDITRVLRFANRHGIRVVGRGRGHTAFGQAQVLAGVVFDLSTLHTVHHLGKDHVIVDAGIRWNALLEVTLAQGLMPPALTDFIGQTVGGTLSVGGIGGMVFRQGAQVDNVLELQVVTGEGRLLTCSPTRHRELFDAVLAGQGQVALIVRATLRLVPAPTRIRLFTLVYGSLAGLTSDAVRLMEAERFDFLEAFAVPQSDGSWVHVLQAGRYGASPLPQGDAALLVGLHDLRHLIEFEDLSFSAFANRVPELPVQPHPWIDLILPYPAIDAFVMDVEQTLRPLVAGDRGSILLIPMRPQRFSKPLFRAPQTKFAFGFGILRSMPAVPTAVAQAVDFNRTLFDRCRDLGGTHYPISAVNLGRDDWALHYGPEFPRLVAAKARHDRRNVLAGGPDIF